MPTAKIVLVEEQQQQPEEATTPSKTLKKQDLLPSQVFKPTGPKSAPLIVRPRVMLFDISETMLPMPDSIIAAMSDKRNNTIPFFHGRKFKIGWSRGNQLTVLGTRNSVFGGRSSDDSSKSIVKVLQVKSMLEEKSEKFRKSIVGHLEIELKHDKRFEGSTRLEAGGGTAGLLEHHQLAQRMAKDDGENFNASVWALMHALWGFIDDVDPQEHAIVMLRRDLLSAWLESVVTDADLLKANVDYLDRVVNLMMCHKVRIKISKNFLSISKNF